MRRPWADPGLVPPRGVVVHTVRRVRHHQVGLGTVHEALDRLLVCRVSAHDPVLPEHPEIACARDRVLRRLRDVVRVRLAVHCRQRQDVIEREDVQVVKPGERVGQQVGVPGRQFGRPVVDHAEGARLASRDGDHRRAAVLRSAPALLVTPLAHCGSAST